MGTLAPWMILALSCTRAEVQEWWVAPEQMQFVSPSAASEVVSDQIPVLIRVPARFAQGTAVLTLDGRPAADVGLVRRRWWNGKEADYLSTISTAGLAPGTHTLSLWISDGEGETWTVRRRFELALRPNRLVIHLSDENGQPRSGRVEFFDMDGVRVDLGSPGDVLADPSERDAVRSSLLIIGGEGQVYLRPGRYQVLASSGIRDGIDQAEITVPGVQTLALRVPRLIHTPGLVTVDLHVHSGMSGDAFISERRRWRSLVAAGVEVGVLTDHNKVRDPRPAIELLGLDGQLVLVPGVEFRFGPSGESIGHGNAFPVAPGSSLPRPGSKDPAEVVAGWRSHAQGRPMLIQLNHPRGIQFWPDKPHQVKAHALFSELGMVPGLPLGEQADSRLFTPDPVRGERIVDVDALEILNRFSLEAWRSVRQDWFQLMNQGWFPTGTGNADSHSVELERPGFPVNLVQIDPADRSDPAALVQAVSAGRLIVSSGPVVRLRVSAPGRPSASPGDMLSGPLKEVRVEVEVLAAPWVPVPELRIIVDGEVHHISLLRGAQAAGVLRGAWSGIVPIEGDTWILAEAGWAPERLDRPTEGRYPRVAPGHVPIGFTNPVRVDTDGDGRWTPRVDPRLSEEGDSGTFDRDDTVRED
jgi:hypothetical protein